MVEKHAYLSLFIIITVFLLTGSSVYGSNKYVAGELIVKYKESINHQIVYAASGKMKFSALNPSLLNLHQRYGLEKMHRVLQSLDAPGLGICSAASFRAHLSKSRKRRPYFKPQDPATIVPELHNIYRLFLKNKSADMPAIAREYAMDPSVEYAHPNYIVELLAVPNDPNYSQQWAHQNMVCEPGWDIQTGSNNVVIAIVDTGVDWDHPDLSANIWTNAGETPGNGIDDDSNGFIDDIRGWDFVDAIDVDGTSFAVGEDLAPPDNDPMDFYGHGTMMAGTAASIGNNGIGGTGVAWNCSIMPIRIGAAERSSGNAYITSSCLTQGVYYAGNNGADVINLSLSDNNWPSSLGDALDLAYSQGAVIVAAAGNCGGNGACYPAAYPKVIGVAATDQSDQRAIWGTAQPPLYHPSESNFGAGISVAAPGTAIYSAAFNDSYGSANGTSMSTALVSGLAGLVRSQYPAMSNADVMQVIYSTTDPVTSDKYIGTGRVNVNRALQMSNVPVAEITAPVMEEMLAANYAVMGSAGGANFSSYTLQYGQRYYPGSWTTISTLTSPVTNGVLGTWDIDSVQDNIPYTLRLTVYDTAGNAGISEVIVYVQKNVQPGWPKSITYNFHGDGVAVGDMDNDGDLETAMVVYHPLVGSPALTNDLYVFNSDGSIALGWPVNSLNYSLSAPTLADLTYNGRLNVILAGYDWGSPNSTIKFHVFDDQGNYLPGWPVIISSPNQVISQTPSVGDVDNDGCLEIVFPSRRNSKSQEEAKIYVYRSDGTPLPGWPVSIDMQFPPATGTAQDHVSHAALADLDNDQDLEIVVCVNIYNNCHMYVYHHDTTVATGWPIALGHGWTVSPVIGDLDNDGNYEIIGTTTDGRIYVWNHDGTTYPGWPVTIPVGNHDPALADLDGDGDLEIIFHNAADQVYAYHHNGTLVAGWPRPVQSLAGGRAWSSPIIGDITGDSQPEIILSANDEAMVYAWHVDGSAVAGWPKTIPHATPLSPALVDLNNDGTLDMLLAYANTLNLWSMSIPYQRNDLQWSMSWFNMHHTGTYSRDIEAPVVAITNPAPDATVLSAVNIMANASDNVGVMGVRFKVDGTNIGLEDITAPYSIVWDSTTVSNGSHILTALARDRAGQQTLSQGITVNVNNPTPTPTITATHTPSSTISPTTTVTYTVTPTSTPASSSTIFPTATVTFTVTPTSTPTPSPTISPTSTITPTSTPSSTISPTSTITPTVTFTPTLTPSPTSFSHINQGEIIVIGSTEGRGAINPDQGQSALIYFNAAQTGRVECRIFTLTGELVWQEKMENVREGRFEWKPVEAAAGIYIVLVKGPGLEAKKKIAILK